jgi:hypothetical protein
MENEIDYTELYRQNYQDALDEIRELKFRIAQLEEENRELRNTSNRNNYILDTWAYLYKK